MTVNTSNITGDSNIVLQNINARDITLIIGKDLPIEIKQQKESMNVKFKELAETLAQLDEKVKAAFKPAAFVPPEDNQAYESIRWNRIIEALEMQGCILFIGPEISVDSQGRSLHQQFYKELAKDIAEEYNEKKVEYLENEGYFSPESDELIRGGIIKYYSKDFPKKNQIGRKIIEQLAQVPFSLVVSLCPDDTIHRVFSDFDIKHQFVAYNGMKQEVDPISPENPVIYNMLGNAATLGSRYIFTHENFYNYLHKVQIPDEIKLKFQQATSYLFIGFDFNKWYNRLLLFILELDQKKGARRMSIGKKDVKEDIERFVARQFNITFVDNDYIPFIEWLIHNVKESGEVKLRNLHQGFIHNSFIKLKSLSARVGAEDNLDELLKLESLVGEIAANIANFQQKITT